MITETLVALPDDLKAALDRRAPSPPERNELIAAALRAYFAWPRPGEDAADLAVINANAAELNAEAEDALSYQIPLRGVASSTLFNTLPLAIREGSAYS